MTDETSNPTQPEDWVMVPRVPTKSMLDEARAQDRALILQGFNGAEVEGVWEAMLSAAPTISPRGSEDRETALREALDAYDTASAIARMTETRDAVRKQVEARTRLFALASLSPRGRGSETDEETNQLMADLKLLQGTFKPGVIGHQIVSRALAALSSAPVSGGGESLDAARWRALMSVPRIRMQGSAGVDPKTGKRRNGPAVHFGAEFWTDTGDDYDRSKDPQNALEWGLAALTATADRMIERNAAIAPPQPSAAESETQPDNSRRNEP